MSAIRSRQWWFYSAMSVLYVKNLWSSWWLSLMFIVWSDTNCQVPTVLKSIFIFWIFRIILNYILGKRSQERRFALLYFAYLIWIQHMFAFGPLYTYLCMSLVTACTSMNWLMNKEQSKWWDNQTILVW